MMVYRSPTRIVASLVASILARPIGLPLLVSTRRADASVNALLDDGAFELCKYAEQLKSARPAGWLRQPLAFRDRGRT